ncbi:unnamed protein product, partial [Rotaria socialis]
YHVFLCLVGAMSYPDVDAQADNCEDEKAQPHQLITMD